MSKLFYILDVESIHRDALLWWRPNNAGYTMKLEHAGQYTEEQVRESLAYYHNGDRTLAVPVEEVDRVASRVVSADHAEALKEKARTWREVS